MIQSENRKYLFIFIFTLLLLTFMNADINACTGFCVYGKNTLYGMNFDYPDTELKFLIKTQNGMNIFHLYFSTGTSFIGTAGINDRGLISTLQFQYPIVYNTNPKQSNEKYFGELYNQVLNNYSSLEQVENYLNNYNLVQTSYNTIHTLIGAKDTTAAIFEAGNENNMITRLENNYLVMTNFCNSSYTDIPASDINDVGADRYRFARYHIEENILDYDIDDAIETLKLTAQYDGDFPTQCSMVFSPNTNEVYIIIRRNFEKIWKLSLDTKTIETYRGFTTYKSMPVNSTGVLASTLMDIETDIEDSDFLLKDFQLYQNYPNPFNPETTINYSLNKAAEINLSIYDIKGSLIKTLEKTEKAAGQYSVTWDGKNMIGNEVSSGIYFYRLSSKNHQEEKKMLLIK